MTQECSEPLCSPSNVLTTQCTDQCVVIACDDPDHGVSLCDKRDTCDIAVDCTDCHGLDAFAFLQCCENYGTLQPITQQPQRVAPNLTFSWDSPFSDVWCSDCSPKPTNFNRSLDSNLQNFSATQNGSQSVLQLHQQHYQLDSYPHVVPNGRPNFSCMWGSCHATFSSLSELIGHVNLHHLVCSSSTLNSDNVVRRDSPKFDQMKPPTTLSCLWADCSSPDMFSFSDMDLLTYHLLREHLGVTPPPTTPMNPPVENPVTQSTLSPSLSFDTIVQDSPRSLDVMTQIQAPLPSSPTSGCENDLQTCTGTHECKWKECSLFFSTCTELTAHITATHIGSGKAQYECYWHECNRNGNNGFQSKQKICRHVQSHTGHRPFQCTMCQQYFSEAATLQQHVRRHTQQKPYICDHPGCGKSFAITGALTIHKRTHNGDKPFKCPYCDRGFAESSNLSKHLRTHTGARPYACTEHGCDKAFARPDQLNRHKTVHKKQQRGIGSNG